jgi:predicted DNA-binding transcriptional regulator AlpA
MHTQHHQAPPSAAPLDDLARLDKREVCRLVGRSPSSLDEMRREGRFPEPDYRDGPRCVRWSAGLVRRWLMATTQQSA